MRALLLVLMLVAWFLFAWTLVGCAERMPSRNMNDMTADELRRELSRPLVRSTEP